MLANKPTLTLSFTLLVVMLGYGMVLPVMPFYIEMLGAGGRELGLLLSMYSFMQLICAPLWGILSDRIGRKPVLTIGILGYAITLLMFGLATQFWMLLVARTLSGILSSATMPTALAYIGDNAPENERSSRMGLLGAAMGIGIVVGPLLGGLLSADSLALPFFVGAGMAFLAFLLVLWILPESFAPAATRTPNQIRARDAVLGVLLGPVGILLVLIFIMSFGLSNFQGVVGLFVVDKFKFDTKQVGAIWMVMGGVMIVSQGMLTGPLTKKFGETALVRAGLAGGAFGFVGMALAVDFASTMVSLGLFTLALALVGPALNAYISSAAGERQGTAMGLNSAATSLGRVVGPLWAGYLYDIDIGLPYVSGAGALLLGLAVSVLALQKKSESTEESVGEPALRI